MVTRAEDPPDERDRKILAFIKANSPGSFNGDHVQMATKLNYFKGTLIIAQNISQSKYKKSLAS
ncbi:MAG: hypothetical protein ACK518_03555 [bacterium]